MKSFCSFAVLFAAAFLNTPAYASVNAGDFSGGVAIGTSYAGVDSAPTNGLIVQGGVGIGTPTPLSYVALDLESSSSAGNAPIIYLRNTDGPNSGTFGPTIEFNNGVSGANPFILEEFQSSASEFTISNANSPYTAYFSISQAGNVGIQNTSPSYLLHVGSGSASGIVLELQNSSGACTYNPGASSVTVSCSSDMRLKDDIEDSENALPWINGLRIRDFTVKATGQQATGVVAQEVLSNYPDMVHVNSDGYYSVEEPNPWKLVKAIQEQQREIQKQQTEIQQQHDEIGQLKETIEHLDQPK